jgi:hydroxymethylpyrimidine/phosphomethylpyrimidine kinase
LDSIRTDLLPHIVLATPNSEEARRISGKEDLIEAAAEMLSMGCNNILITGAHEKSENVINTFYQGSVENARSLEWPRLPYSYHGSGCTLASAISARIALGQPMAQAATDAQEYTWQSLNRDPVRPNGGPKQHSSSRPSRFLNPSRLAFEDNTSWSMRSWESICARGSEARPGLAGSHGPGRHPG